MPYRGGPREDQAAADPILPARIAGAAALAAVVVSFAMSALPRETWFHWYEAGSSVPFLLDASLRLAHAGIAGGSALFALHATDRRRRALAAAGALLLAVAIGAWLSSRAFPAPLEIDRTRPYWAPAKYLFSTAQTVSDVGYAGGLAAVAWALATRATRTAATIAVVVVAGLFAHDAWYALERPWVQLYTPGPSASITSFDFEHLFFALPLVSLAVLALGRRSGPPEPAAFRDARAFDAIAPVIAAASAAAAMPAFLAVTNAAMIERRGDGPMRLEYFESLVVRPHGAFVAAGVFAVAAAHRASVPMARTFAALTTTAMAAVSIVAFMRGRWKLPITSTYFFENLQVAWAVAGALLLAVCVVLVRVAFDRVAALAASDRDDISAQLVETARRIARALEVALGAAMLSLLGIAWADETSSRATHEAVGVLAGLAGVASIVAALVASRAHARARDTIAEGIRRRSASAPESPETAALTP